MKKFFILILIIFTVLCIFADIKYTYNFNDKTKTLKILSHTPSSLTLNDNFVNEIVFTFNKPIVALESVRDLNIKYTSDPKIEGKFRIRGTNTIVFIPEKTLIPYKEYSFILLKGITANDGSVLKEDYKITIKPSSLRMYYQMNYTNEFPLDSPIYLILDYPIDLKTLEKSITIKPYSQSIYIPFTITPITKDTNYINQYKIRIDFKNKLDINKSYLFTFDNYLRRSPYSFTFKTYDYFNFDENNIVSYQLSYNEESEFSFSFTNSVSPYELYKNAYFINEKGNREKFIPSNNSYNAKKFYVMKLLKPQTTYSIELLNTLKDIHGNNILNPGIYNFTTKDYHPFLYINNFYLYNRNNTSLLISSMNINKYTLYVKFLSVKDFIKYFQKQNFNDFKNKKNMQKYKIIADAEKNTLFENKININKTFRNNTFLGYGYIEYYLNKDNRFTPFYFQKSNVRMHFIISNKNAYILSYNRKHNNPLKFGKILHYNDNASIIGRYVTENGICKINKKSMNKIFSNYYMFKFIMGLYNDDNILLPYNREKIHDYDKSYIFTDRNLYTLNDSVIISGIVRTGHANIIEYSKIKNSKYTIKNSNHIIVKKGKIHLDNNGFFKLIIQIPDSFITGYYYVNFENIGSCSFLIEEFKKPKFEININSEKNKYYKNDNLKITIKANYLSGIKMQNDSVYLKINVSKSNFYSSKYNNLNFHIEDDTIRINNPFFSYAHILDKKGEIIIKHRIKNNKLKNPLSLHLLSSVKSIDKETISKSIYTTYYPLDEYAGVSIAKDTLKNDSLYIEYALISAKEEFIKNKKMKIVLLKSISQNFSFSDTVFSKNVISKDTIQRLYFTYEKNMYYKAIIVYKGNHVSQKYIPYRYYYNYSYSQENEFIKTDKEHYSIGDTAKIQITNFNNDGIINFFYGTDSIFVLKSFDKNKIVNYEIPITENLHTGFYVCAFISSEDSTIDKNLYSKYINVSNDNKKLNVVLVTSKKIYKPADTVELSLKNDNNEDIQIVITVIDESTLMLTDYYYHNPLSIFYTNYSSYFSLFNSDQDLYNVRNYYRSKSLYMEDGESFGMSDKVLKQSAAIDEAKEEIETTGHSKKLPAINAKHIRKDFSQTVFYKYISIKKNSTETLKFKLPDSISKFRINIIAFTKEKFNLITDTIKTQKNIIINSSLPNFLRPYDTFKLTYSIIDNTKTEGDISTGIEKSNLELSNNTFVYAPTKQKREISFKAKTPFTDTVNILMYAKKNDDGDYLQIKIPVINKYLYENTATYYALDDSTIEIINIDTTIIKRKSTLTISMNSSEIGQMELPLKYLENYPYLCLEQKLSRILPFLIGEEIINAYNLSEIKGKKLRKYVNNVLKEVHKFQSSNGGFKYYKDSPYISEYLSIYTMYVLYYAIENNYNIKQEIIDKGLEYLESLTNGDFQHIWNYNKYEQISIANEAIYVLSLYGKDYFDNEITYIYNNRDYLYISSKAHLYSAMKLYNMKEKSDTLFSELLSSINIETHYAYFDDGLRSYWTFQNELKNTAIVLTAILRNEDNFANDYKIIKFFQLRIKNGMWVNTHTTAYVMEALTEYFKKYEKNNIDFTAIAELNNKQIIKEKYKGYNKKQINKILELKTFNDGENILKMYKQGTGRLYYSLQMKYARKNKIQPLFNGITVYKIIENMKGKTVNKINRGEIYKIKLKIITPKSRVFVNIDDPLPAGFDIIKRSFVTEAINQQGMNRNKNWWGGFSHEEYYKDRVIANALYLSKGTHYYTYYVRAIVSGNFSMPPTNVFEMYTPEVFGHTGSKIINVE